MRSFNLGMITAMLTMLFIIWMDSLFFPDKQDCDYHITIIEDVYTLKDVDGRVVKVFKYGEMPLLDSIIDKDNL